VNAEQPERSARGPHSVPRPGIYTQVNILFPSEQVELPSAEKFKAFPPDAQKAILAAFEREQIERHVWLKNQQANEHQLNLQSGRQYFIWRLTGTIAGAILAISALVAGASLVQSGASTIGVMFMILAVAGLVGTAIYGHRAQKIASQEELAKSGKSLVKQSAPD